MAAVMLGVLVVVATVWAAAGAELSPPEGLTFSDEVGGPASEAKQATLTNTGDEVLENIAVGVTGDADRFALVSHCDAPLQPTESCTIDVAFSAAAPGDVTSSLEVTSSGPAQSIPLAGTGTPPPVPVASIDPTSLAFDAVAGTTTAAQSVTLHNTGDADLEISAITIVGTDAARFDRTDNCGSSLAPDAQCTVDVTFSPAAAGSSAATLRISDNDPGSAGEVALTGTATAAPAPIAGIAPTSLGFSTASGTTSAPQSVTLSNTGNAPLQISSVAIVGSDRFEISSNSCGGSLASNATCTVDVIFSPTATGSRSAVLRFTDNHQGTPGATQNANLNGTGTAGPAPVAVVAPTGLTFSTTASTTSAPQSVTLSNTGNAPLQISSVTIVGADAARFAISSNSCDSSLAASAQCTVGVTFSPTTTGSHSASLRFTDNDQGTPGATQNVTLAGTGTAAPTAVASVTPASLTFSTPTGATSAAQSATLRNTGDATLTISRVALSGTGAAQFAIADGCGATLAPGAQCVVDVTFHPVANGSRSANLVFTDSNQGPGGPTQTVALIGTGEPAPIAGVTPASLSFTTSLGTVSATQRATLTNSGTANLTSVGVSIVGANFTIAGTNCSSVLAPGANCVVDVTFTPPSLEGPLQATLRFSGNDPVRSTQDVALSGTATRAAEPPVVVVPPPATPPPATPPPTPPAPATPDPDGDSDGDDVPNSTDLCRATAGNLANGCPGELNAEIRGSWRVNRLLSQLMTLTVRAPTGSRIATRCSNGRGRCGFTVRTIAKTTKRTTSLTRYFKGRRILSAGTIITVRVTRPLQIGSYKQLTTRRGRQLPRVLVRCLDAGNGKTRACP